MKLLERGGLFEDINLNLRISDWPKGLPFQSNVTANHLEINIKRNNIFVPSDLDFQRFTSFWP